MLGRPITALRFAAPEYAQPRPPALLFGAIHGDEPLGVHCLGQLIVELIERPPGRVTWIVPALNIDGLAAGTKNNANDIDLNRNFSAENWSADHKPGYSPGRAPESEPETRALVELIDGEGIERIVALHSPFRVVNWDGAGKELAEQMGDLNGYGASGDIGYPTPGSLGSKYGVDRGLEVVTLEIPFLEQEQAWQENRSALRFAVDLPA
ncbi:MAG: succinylglutamate desuccinylase/aspartoacylase family protein [Deltaproteobacteria bacterium]|nr:succinylglutamate desuccinylase/aspartoacylase family protein [Deltaproteobacteria bacterium]